MEFDIPTMREVVNAYLVRTLADRPRLPEGQPPQETEDLAAMKRREWMERDVEREGRRIHAGMDMESPRYWGSY